MSQTLKIKRGLFRLGTATVKQLANFSGVSESTVEVFLNKRNDLCISSMTGDHEDGPRVAVWTLTESGRAVLRQEIERDLTTKRSKDFDRERRDAYIGITTAISRMDIQITNLEKNYADDDFDDVLSYLSQRKSAISQALTRLVEIKSSADVGFDVAIQQVALHGFEARLDAICSKRKTFQNAKLVARDSIFDGILVWMRSLANELGDFGHGVIGNEDLFVPEAPNFGPLLIIDCSAAQHDGTVVLEAARRANAPAMRLHVQALAEAQLKPVLSRINEHCERLAGSWTRLVYTFDSSHPRSSEFLAACRAFDNDRRISLLHSGPKKRSPLSPGDINVIRAKQILDVVYHSSNLEDYGQRIFRSTPIAVQTEHEASSVWVDVAYSSIFRDWYNIGFDWTGAIPFSDIDEVARTNLVSASDLMNSEYVDQPDFSDVDVSSFGRRGGVNSAGESN